MGLGSMLGALGSSIKGAAGYMPSVPGDVLGRLKDQMFDGASFDDAQKQALLASMARLQAQATQHPSQSIAGQMLRQALGQNVAAQQSLASSAPASQQAMARRMAMQQAGKMGGELAGQQALAASMEQQRALQALIEAQLAMRGQDVERYKSDAAQPRGYERLLGGLTELGKLYATTQKGGA